MTIFANYAAYYNALYKDKNYKQEVDFTLSLARSAGIEPHTLLDLGCGTGRHALEMAQQGIAVSGVDLSPCMLSIAEDSLRNASLPSQCPLPSLMEGDVRTVRLSQHFDMVTSLFHVMSYQNTEEDALALLSTAHAHLHTQGIFIFDFWYGPCVLRERPEHRKKILHCDECCITRTAAPVLHINENRVDVHYDIALEDATSGLQAIHEIHAMRYWFLPELQYLARNAGFKVLDQGAWLTNEAPSDTSWGAWLMVQKC